MRVAAIVYNNKITTTASQCAPETGKSVPSKSITPMYTKDVVPKEMYVSPEKYNKLPTSLD